MAQKICKNGHTFEKSSSCSVCPICSSEEMNKKYGNEFPKIGAPAFRALDTAGITHFSQLTQHTKDELLALHGFGPKALELLRKKLAVQGKSFAKK